MFVIIIIIICSLTVPWWMTFDSEPCPTIYPDNIPRQYTQTLYPDNIPRPSPNFFLFTVLRSSSFLPVRVLTSKSACSKVLQSGECLKTSIRVCRTSWRKWRNASEKTKTRIQDHGPDNEREDGVVNTKQSQLKELKI